MAARRIYLDHASATPPDARVLRISTRTLARDFGNPSALHREGRAAAALLTAARREIARVLAAHEDEIVFTGSGTEANNLAIAGVAAAVRAAVSHPHFVASAIEHPSVLAPLEELARRGESVTTVGVEESGVIRLSELKRALGSKTVLVSVMYANNEIGTIQPIREVARIIRAARKKNGTPYPYFHVDACQAGNYLDLHAERLGADLISLNSSKVYGPRGIGALFVRRGVELDPIIRGGGQERGRRSGTEDVAAAAGFSTALAYAQEVRERETRRLTALRDLLIRLLLARIPDAALSGDPVRRLPNNVHISIPGVDIEQLIIELDARGIAVSAKSACKSIDEEVSHVMMAIGKDAAASEGGLRLTLGRGTRKGDVVRAAKILPATIQHLRAGEEIAASMRGAA